jgi:hypothetical protein
MLISYLTFKSKPKSELDELKGLLNAKLDAEIADLKQTLAERLELAMRNDELTEQENQELAQQRRATIPVATRVELPVSAVEAPSTSDTIKQADAKAVGAQDTMRTSTIDSAITVLPAPPETTHAPSWQKSQNAGNIYPPAIGLLLAAFLGFSTHFLLFTIGLLSNLDKNNDTLTRKIISAAMSYTFAGASVFIAVGAFYMLKRQHYRLALTASVLAMFSMCLGSILGLPFGIWCLIILLKPQVRSSFR